MMKILNGRADACRPRLLKVSGGSKGSNQNHGIRMDFALLWENKGKAVIQSNKEDFDPLIIICTI